MLEAPVSLPTPPPYQPLPKNMGTTNREVSCKSQHPSTFFPFSKETSSLCLGAQGSLQYSGLENSMDCVVHGVSKSWTQLSNFHSLTHSVSNSVIVAISLSDVHKAPLAAGCGGRWCHTVDPHWAFWPPKLGRTPSYWFKPSAKR